MFKKHLYNIFVFAGHHPKTKPEKTQNYNLSKPFVFLGTFFQPISTFYHVNWDSEVHFDNLQVK